MAHEGRFSLAPVEGLAQSPLQEGPFPGSPGGSPSQLIYRPALSLASDCRHLFFFFFTSRPKRGRAGIVLCDCSRCRRTLPLPPLVLPHTVCIVLPGTLQGLACGRGIQGVRRLHLTTLAANILQPRGGICASSTFRGV